MAIQDKSMYIFRVSSTPEEIEEVMQSWLEDNHFEYVIEGEHSFYQNHKRCMEYMIQEDQVTLYVYLKNRRKTIGLENGLVGMMDAMSYISILTPLFTELNDRSVE